MSLRYSIAMPRRAYPTQETRTCATATARNPAASSSSFESNSALALTARPRMTIEMPVSCPVEKTLPVMRTLRRHDMGMDAPPTVWWKPLPARRMASKAHTSPTRSVSGRRLRTRPGVPVGAFLDAVFLPLDLDSREATRLKPTSLMYMRPTIWRTDASTKSSLMMRWALRK